MTNKRIEDLNGDNFTVLGKISDGKLATSAVSDKQARLANALAKIFGDPLPKTPTKKATESHLRLVK